VQRLAWTWSEADGNRNRDYDWAFKIPMQLGVGHAEAQCAHLPSTYKIPLHDPVSKIPCSWANSLAVTLVQHIRQFGSEDPRDSSCKDPKEKSDECKSTCGRIINWADSPDC
jgi:hypothetical protein